MRNVFKKKIAPSPIRLVRKGVGWNHADQLLPVDAEEEALEMELDEIPLGIVTTPRSIAVVLMVMMAVVTEFTLLRADGLMGPAVFFPIAALLICIGIPGRSFGPHTIIVGAMLCAVSLRLATNGTWVHLIIAGWLLTALTLCFRHQKPFLLQTLLFGVESLYLGYEFFLSFPTKISRAFVPPDEDRTSVLFNYGLPALVVAIMGIAGLAMQPELLTQFGQALNSQRSYVQSAATTLFDMNIVHVGVWLLTVWITAGFLRPILSVAPEVVSDITPMEDGTYHAPLFVPLRNTLVTILAVFGVLLFLNLTGFSNSLVGGAPFRGLKILAIAAPCSVALIAVIFTGPNLADNRIESMRKLSCGLLGLNLVFALMVAYGYSSAMQVDGVSRYDIQQVLAMAALVGLLGVAACLVFVQHNATWLLRRAGWIVAVVGFIYFVLPVDRLICQYNVAQIVDGNVGAMARITDSQMPAEAIPELIPLCHVEERVIREGAMALLADGYFSIRQLASAQDAQDWTANQMGVSKSLRILQDYREQNTEAFQRPNHKQARIRFSQFAQD